jgi:hypothetical protein
MTTDEQIIELLKRRRIAAMKNPTILMNSDDLNNFESELKSKVQNFELGKNPKYMNVPIESSPLFPRGEIIVYDKLITTY